MGKQETEHVLVCKFYNAAVKLLRESYFQECFKGQNGISEFTGVLF